MIKYNIHQDPPRKDGQPAARHLRTVGLKPVDSKTLSRAMHRRSGVYSEGCCIGVLIDMVDTLPELLAKGCAVHIDGLGTFSPRVEGEVVNATRGTKVDNLRVGTVEFQPDEQLLCEVNRHARFEHVLETRRTKVPDAEVSAFLVEHFATHSRLLRHHLESHFHLSKRRALELLNRLVAAGRLHRKGQTGNMWYEMAE